MVVLVYSGYAFFRRWNTAKYCKPALLQDQLRRNCGVQIVKLPREEKLPCSKTTRS